MAVVDELKVLQADQVTADKETVTTTTPAGDPTAVLQGSEEVLDPVVPDVAYKAPEVDQVVDPPVITSPTEQVLYDTVNLAENQADAEYSYQAEKAKAEAITRRQTNLGENARSIQEFFTSEYNLAAKADKFGWNGGQLMTAEARNKFLQAQLNADIYQREAYVTAELDTKLAVAREYKNLKLVELEQAAYNDAVSQALSRAQITGYYVSPEAADMLNQYKMALADTNVNQDQANAVKTHVEDYFLALGFGEDILDAGGQPVLDANGNPEQVIDPNFLTSMMDYTSTLATREQEFNEFMYEAGREEALNQLELQYNTDLDGDQKIGGFDNPILEGATVKFDDEWMYWNNDDKVWMNKVDYDVRVEELSEETNEDGTTSTEVKEAIEETIGEDTNNQINDYLDLTDQDIATLFEGITSDNYEESYPEFAHIFDYAFTGQVFEWESTLEGINLTTRSITNIGETLTDNAHFIQEWLQDTTIQEAVKALTAGNKMIFEDSKGGVGSFNDTWKFYDENGKEYTLRGTNAYVAMILAGQDISTAFQDEWHSATFTLDNNKDIAGLIYLQYILNTDGLPNVDLNRTDGTMI